MTRDSRHGSLWKGLACLLTLQSALAHAQVAEMEKATNDSLLWGPYRPNVYFGVRPRIPKSLMGGLMWARVEDYQSVQNSEWRHQAISSVAYRYIPLHTAAYRCIPLHSFSAETTG